MRQCKSEDVFVVYLAGHGVIGEGAHAGYHYLLDAAASEELGDDAGAVALSGKALLRLVREVPAVKRQLLVQCDGNRL